MGHAGFHTIAPRKNVTRAAPRIATVCRLRPNCDTRPSATFGWENATQTAAAAANGRCRATNTASIAPRNAGSASCPRATSLAIGPKQAARTIAAVMVAAAGDVRASRTDAPASAMRASPSSASQIPAAVAYGSRAKVLHSNRVGGSATNGSNSSRFGSTPAIFRSARQIARVYGSWPVFQVTPADQYDSKSRRNGPGVGRGRAGPTASRIAVTATANNAHRVTTPIASLRRCRGATAP